MAETVQRVVPRKQDVFTASSGRILDGRAVVDVSMEANQESWILVLEDDEDDLSLTMRALRKVAAGVRVEAAKDGESAIRVLEGEAVPSLVLMDAHMPRMSGEDILRRAKSDPRLQEVPFIVFSSSIAPFEAAGFMDAGAAEVLTKPLDFAEYNATLESVVSRLR